MAEVNDLFETAPSVTAGRPAGSTKQDAAQTLAAMPGDTKLADVLDSIDGEALQALTLGEIREVLGDSLLGIETSFTRRTSFGTVEPEPMPEGSLFDALASASAKVGSDDGGASSPDGETLPLFEVRALTDLSPLEVEEDEDELKSGSQDAASNEERLYLAILETLQDGAKTIGQLSKAIAVDTMELRGYLQWMQQMGKVSRSGRARATRYHLPQSM